MTEPSPPSSTPRSTLLRSLRVRHFKRFADATFALSPLTLLTGLNGMGKSTVIQALQMAISSLSSQTDLVALNSPSALLGTADDVFTLGEQPEAIQIDVTSLDGNTGELSFTKSKDPLLLSIAPHPSLTAMRGRAGHLTGRPWLAYLSAERLGPRLSLPLAAQGESEWFVGPNGQLTADCLERKGATYKVSPQRQYPRAVGEADSDTDIITLLKQTERWMGELVPGLSIKVAKEPALLQAALLFSTRALSGEWVRATHMGFGVSYALPVFVQGMLMAPGSILVVENPEAHLHPAGQSAIGRFLARCAADGVQVIVETHSDHVLNGIRLAVKRGELAPEATQVHFFERSGGADGSVQHGVVSPVMDRQGRFDRWPKDFFDEWERSLDALISES